MSLYLGLTPKDPSLPDVLIFVNGSDELDGSTDSSSVKNSFN